MTVFGACLPVIKQAKTWVMNLLSAPRQPFVGLAVMAGIGIVVADFVPVSSFATVTIAVLIAVLALIAFFCPLLPVTYALVSASFFLLHNFRTTDTEGLLLAAQLAERPRVVNVTGAVASEPKVRPTGYATFLLKLESIELEGKTLPTNATWFVRWRGIPEFGDELKLFGVAEPIAPPRNPGEFDLRSYLARRDVRRSLFVRYEENGTIARHGGGNSVSRAAHKSRDWLQNALCRGLENSPDVQRFISGITLGLRREAPEEIEETFQETGTLHLFAVSGLHVGIFAELLWILASVSRVRRKLATALIIPTLFFYASVTGLHVSSVRAAVMASILLAGIFFERKVFLLNSLAAAAFFLLSWNTNELFATGFQLSFAVVAAIILLADRVVSMLRRCNAPDPFLPLSLLRGPRQWLHQGLEWLSQGASVSFAAWTGSLVFILAYFHLVTPIALAANLLVVPLAFFILATALLSILTAPFASWLSIVFNNANWFLAKLVLGSVHLFVQVPGGHFYLEHPHRPEHLLAKITALDLGAGAAIHVRTRGADWLVDCGGERDYERVVRRYLHSVGVNRLQGLLLTHGDSLHIGGTESLLADYPPTRLIDNHQPDRSSVHRRLRRLFQQRGINSDSAHAFQLSRDVKAQILYPLGKPAATKADDQAHVVRLSVGRSISILFTSDAGVETEHSLLASKSDLRSDILVKGQHVSGKSGSLEFLDAVQPKLIIATSRDFPERERISDEWAATVQAHGIKLFRQDETGAVTLRVGRNSWEAQAHITGEIFRSASQ